MEKSTGSKSHINILGVFTAIMLCVSCSNLQAQKPANPDYLVKYTEEESGQSGYKNRSGKVVIAAGLYNYCFTDTFITYAIVQNEQGFVAIDRKQTVLYTVFTFDNGPDYAEQGLFRIVKDGKIGYASVKTGKIIIAPQYTCAYPFENGKAKVALKCTATRNDEISEWNSDEWFYIDRKGLKVVAEGRK